MTKLPPNRRVLVLWSAGVESTSLLKWLLENTSEEIQAHYIEFRNPENRTDMELQALRYLRGELRKIRPFGLDYSYASLCDGKAWPADFVWQFSFGASAMLYHGCRCLYRGRCAEDEWQRHTDRDGNHSIKRDFPELGGLHRYKAGIMRYTLPEWYSPEAAAPWHKLYEKSKGWHLRHLGKLAGHTWSCRKPVGGLTRCGKCQTCLEIEAGLQGTSYNPHVAAMIAAGEIE